MNEVAALLTHISNNSEKDEVNVPVESHGG